MQEKYAKFISKDEMQKKLKKITKIEEMERSGIPLYYDDKAIYVDESFGHNLVIGSTGSGKTQTIILPKVYTSIAAEENIIIEDHKGEILHYLKDELKEKEYHVIALNFYDFNDNTWNPLELASVLFKEKHIDNAYTIIEKVAFYLLQQQSENEDPFWVNSARNLFIGTSLLILNNHEELNISNIYNKVANLTLKDIEKLNDTVMAKGILKNILSMPNDTKGSVIAVFNNLLLPYTKGGELTNFLSKTNFDLNDITRNKIAIFIIGNYGKKYINELVPLFIEEILYVIEENNNNKKTNIILDDFANFVIFDNLIEIFSISRSYYVEFTIVIKSLHEIFNRYKETYFENILSYFSRIIYLYASDNFTREYLSLLCGKNKNNEPLITETELKLMEIFEAIVLKSRTLPFKTKLLPFYQYQIKK